MPVLYVARDLLREAASRKWLLALARCPLPPGTDLGGLVLWLARAPYGAGGLVAILGFKTGAWTARPLAAAALAAASFAPIYAARPPAALFARSTALSAAVGS